ncbi:MAG TPA: branched-chain amino acid ABC transporter permease, partial [Dehalococcoidia bacterium]
MAAPTADPVARELAWQQARRAAETAGPPLLWIAIAAFGVWAAVAHTDPFVTGVIVGSILALGALGLTFIYGVLKFAHFAHGDAMMLAAYLVFFLLTGRVVGTRAGDAALPWSLEDLPGATTAVWDFSFGYGLILSIPLAAVLTAGLLLALDRAVYRPLRGRRARPIILAIASLAIAIALRSVVLGLWGPTGRSYTSEIRPTVQIPYGPRVVTDQLFILAATVVLVALVYLVLYRTRTGKAMRATADNAELARVSGIDTEAVVRWTWALSGLLIAVAGTLLALQSQLKPELGFTLLLPLFAATIVGGLGSPQGALAGGLIVGVVQE